jgi:hypothetical protein
VKLRLVDRSSRYTAEGWMSPRDRNTTDEVAKLASEWRDGMREETRKSLELLGDPAKVTAEVQTPLTRQQAAARTRQETYRWFVLNDKGARKYLRALERNGYEIPEIDELWDPHP